jgi:hypothetical protein
MFPFSILILFQKATWEGGGCLASPHSTGSQYSCSPFSIFELVTLKIFDDF